MPTARVEKPSYDAMLEKGSKRSFSIESATQGLGLHVHISSGTITRGETRI